MFGIDSFYFQNKLIDCEFTNLKDMHRYIENRMYCEYYQLHMLVQDYVAKEVTSENVRNKIAVRKKYPAYKNLDPTRVYNFQLVVEIHDHIIISIMELETYRQAKVAELENDTNQSKLGLNIGNLVNSHRFDNALLKEKISMFIRFLQVFHEHHKKYFTRLNIKAKLVIGIINEDIQIKQFNPTGNNLPKNNTTEPHTSIPHTSRPHTSRPHTSTSGHGTSAPDTSIPHTSASDTSASDTSASDTSASDTSASGTSKEDTSEQDMIKSFVNCDNSDNDNDSALKNALENIVSNIPNDVDDSRGLFAPGNNTPTENIIISVSNTMISEESSIDRDGESINEDLSVSTQSNANVSEVSEYDDVECIFTDADIGKRVLVDGYDSIGTLRFVGKHRKKDITRCGVELDDNVGKNNGTVDGFTYFETEDKRGILVSPRKVSFVEIIENEL